MSHPMLMHGVALVAVSLCISMGSPIRGSMASTISLSENGTISNNELQVHTHGEVASFGPETALSLLVDGVTDHRATTPAEIDPTAMARAKALYATSPGFPAIASQLSGHLATPMGRNANNVPASQELEPILQAMFYDATARLRAWGLYFDDVLVNPEKYGIVDAPDSCLRAVDPGMTQCASPDVGSYDTNVGPSGAWHQDI